MAHSNETQGDLIQFTVQMSKLNRLGKTHQERIFVVKLNIKLCSLFHHEQIVWENSDTVVYDTSPA